MALRGLVRVKIADDGDLDIANTNTNILIFPSSMHRVDAVKNYSMPLERRKAMS